MVFAPGIPARCFFTSRSPAAALVSWFLHIPSELRHLENWDLCQTHRRLRGWEGAEIRPGVVGFGILRWESSSLPLTPLQKWQSDPVPPDVLRKEVGEGHGSGPKGRGALLLKELDLKLWQEAAAQRLLLRRRWWRLFGAGGEGLWSLCCYLWLQVGEESDLPAVDQLTGELRMGQRWDSHSVPLGRGLPRHKWLATQPPRARGSEVCRVQGVCKRGEGLPGKRSARKSLVDALTYTQWWTLKSSGPTLRAASEKPGSEPEEVKLQKASKQIVRNAILQAVQQVSQESRQKGESARDSRGSLQLGVGELTKKHEKK
ncbi:PREDICTED: A-kinase anchor protein C18orf42 homolog [Odobenus rosmarus divergens]|uniref:A-kinase anchor protein C18orf42 homolog n=1 Tax=Odobenus rosmarus divergens TaxID=9708 RepID=A0A2U3WRD1_ODORO|nr:PREDICTED: A-kinase anchor protein C18orf42 homolog [Odobenus rosmarus divergens]